MYKITEKVIHMSYSHEFTVDVKIKNSQYMVKEKQF